MGASAAGDYEIKRSLRFNSADDAYLSRTPSSESNRRTWTWSGWIKRCTFGAVHDLFAAYDGSGAYNIIRIGSNDQLNFQTNSAAIKLTNTTLRDPSAWYHIVVAIDTTSGTAADRVIIYINGVRQSLETDNTVTQNTDYFFNTTNAHTIGAYANGTSYHLDGYMTEINFVDGTALTPTSFGETHEDTGQWVPKKYTGAHGTNGFYLNFSDNSNTTSGTLGDDDSSNTNDWTPNNFSVAAGEGNDSLEDTPTNNCCTLNPLKGYGTTYGSLSNGNLDASLGSTSHMAFSSIAIPPSGKWYAECKFTDVETGRAGIKLATDTSKWNGVWYLQQGEIRVDTSVEQSSLATISDNDIVGIAVDRDANTIQFYKNGSTVGSTESISATGDYHFGQQRNGSSGSNPQGSWNFGQRPFAHSAPADHKTLCTANLNEPTILDGSEYFKTVIYTGDNGTARDIAVGFQPDMVWIKNRDQVDWHLLQDSVRGATKSLYVNVDHGENTELANGHVNSFGANGFQVDFGESGNVNANGEDYASWSWKKSASAGFDILTYTGNATNRTISHSLGVKPCMYVVKRLDGSGNWTVWHKSFDGNDLMYLDTTAAKSSGITNVWNDTEPTSSVFSLGTSGGTNGDGNSYVAYLWAEVEGYCKAGTFVGNGNENGTFVYTGFEPAYILWKSTTGEHWQIRDNVRKTYNSSGEAGVILFASNHPAEYTGNSNTDFLSNGFKCRTDAGGTNGSGQTHIYLAFAEQPFKYSNAR